MRYPFEIEWMEGGILSHAARLREGLPIYAPPSADFVPFFYTPGYPALLSALAPLFGGLSFGLARGVSLLSTLWALFLLFRVLQREAGLRYALLGIGLYAALFRTNGAFYDLARPDALFMAILASAVYVARYWESHRGVIFAALLFVLGFMSKQTVSVFVPAVLLYLFWRDRRQALLFLGTILLLIIPILYLYNQSSEGWLWTYIFEGHQGHLFHWKNILLEYWRDLLFLAPLLLLLPLLWFGYKIPVPILSILLLAHWSYAWIFRVQGYPDFPHMYYRELFYLEPRWLIPVPPTLIAGFLLIYRARNRSALPRMAHGFWLWMFVAGAGASALNHSTQWAYSNCFMLISYFAVLLIALAVRDLMEPGAEGEAAQPAPRWRALIPLALLVQLAAWFYLPEEQLPKETDREALAQLEQILEENIMAGPLLMPAHPFYAYGRRGEPVHVHQMGIQDVAFLGGIKDLLPRLREREWGGVIVDERLRVPGLAPNYYVGAKFRFSERGALRAKTGFLVRPESLWLPQDPEPRALVEGISGNFEEEGWRGWSAKGSFGLRPRRSRLPGHQGQRLASSRAQGGLKALGRLHSKPFKVERPRLSFLLAGQGQGHKRWFRLLVKGKGLARIWGPARGRAHLRRRSLDLSAALGEEAILEIVDQDSKGFIAVDDLRWEL